MTQFLKKKKKKARKQNKTKTTHEKGCGGVRMGWQNKNKKENGKKKKEGKNNNKKAREEQHKGSLSSVCMYVRAPPRAIVCVCVRHFLCGVYVSVCVCVCLLCFLETKTTVPES
eukprot:TRINITY_DN4974_c4_g1_i1.p1 TRINITY_DN4974_c4_g1~~TRINITY_DN4974_c4_g1_i1.p1  ORF type:complete len:123 (-),score=1.45 TRINITY_DN4974_c4_g1_i1:181-522(-)